jgi:predicted metal-dependent peptidase
MNLTHKQRIEKAHIAMMRNKDTVWISPIFMIGKVTLTADIPTAGTNGRDVWYGTKFLDKMNDAQVRATVYHENSHKGYRHLIIHKHLVSKYKAQFGEKQAHQLINMAQDYVINRDIKRLAPFLEMWDGLIEYCYDKKYDDEMVWDTVKIAEDLAANAKSGKGGGGMGDSQDQHDWEGAEEIEMDSKEGQALAKEIEQGLRQGQELSRKFSGSTPREVGELLAPAIDYKQALRDYVTQRLRGGEYATYARPNRRYIGANLYMPSTYNETIKSMGFFCDMSGSVGPKEVQECVSELVGCIEMVRPQIVDVLYWDTEVVRHEHYVGDDVLNLASTTKPKGGGGTVPSCVVPFCSERQIAPDVVVWLSDGYVGNDWAEELGVPAFWVITSGGVVPSHLPHAKLPTL